MEIHLLLPQQRFLPQVNEEFAPRPEFTAFTTVHLLEFTKKVLLLQTQRMKLIKEKELWTGCKKLKLINIFPCQLLLLAVNVTHAGFGSITIKREKLRR